MRRPALLVLLTAAALAGCGNDRTAAPDPMTPEDPAGVRVVELGAAEVRFRAPENWPLIAVEGSRAGGISSRRAVVAVWRYARAEPLPRTRAELRNARTRLLERVRARDPGYEAVSARITRRAGARAIELVGRQTIAGLPVRVRSSHLFVRGGEIVVDAYAPPEHFARVDRAVFRPLLASLELTRR